MAMLIAWHNINAVWRLWPLGFAEFADVLQVQKDFRREGGSRGPKMIGSVTGS